jgi:hypothetical protein
MEKKVVFPSLPSVMTKTLGKLDNLLSVRAMRLGKLGWFAECQAMTLGKLGRFAECRGPDTRQTGLVCLVLWARTLDKVAKFA